MKIKHLIYSLIMLIIPLSVSAMDIDYDIDNYYINAIINSSGNLDVEELIVLNGSFNGYEREILLENPKLTNKNEIDFRHDAIYNPTGISNYSAYAKSVSKVSFDIFNENIPNLNVVTSESYAKNEDVLIYDKGNEKIFKMYYKTVYGKTAFIVKYTLDNMVVLHNDVGEIYWQAIGENFSDKIENLHIKVYLPSEDASGKFRVWAHGDLTGEVKNIDNKYLYAKVDTLSPNSPVDIRLTFNSDLIDKSYTIKRTNTNALDKIIKVEEERAQEANNERKKAKKQYFVSVIISSVMIIYQLISILYIYIKYDKEYKSDFFNDYNRDFIDDYNVEVVDYIMNKNLTPNAMSASIMNMIYKKNIGVEKIQDSKKEEYEFKLLNRDNTNPTENYLLDFLFTTVGDDEIFTTKQLHDYAKSTKTYDNFTKSYTTWTRLVDIDGKSKKIYENHFKVILYAVLILLLNILCMIIDSALYIGNYLWIISLIISIIILIYSIVFKKRTIYGNEQFVRWKAFKRFLLDFGTFDIKELPEITLWERYMVYATVLGVADKVSKVMNVKIKEVEATDNTTTFETYYYHTSLAHSINSSVTNAVNTARSTAAQVATSQMSSGSGFGGGFSSGGGFGGGGGGGHGF